MRAWYVRLACLWALAAGAFLSLYVLRFGASGAVITAHLCVLASLFLSVCALRVLLQVLGRRLNCVWLDELAAFGVALVSLALCLWYGVVYLGLAAWGRIPTLNMLSVYLADWRSALEVLGFSMLALLVLFAALLAVLALLWWALRSPAEGSGAANTKAGAGLVMKCVVVLGLLLMPLQYIKHAFASGIHPQEPLAAFFFNGDGARQSHSTVVSPALQRQELQARHAYVPSNAADKRNVIVLVGDALRADHLSLLGYGRATSVHLQRLVGDYQGYVAPAARAVCAESFCGLLGIASARPIHLFVRRPLTLYEVLRRNGYEVSLLLSGDHSNFYGLKEAYGEVDVYLDSTGQQRRAINDDQMLIDWLQELADYDGVTPVAMQFHLMSSHGLGPVAPEHQLYGPVTNYYRWALQAGGRVAESEGDQAKVINNYDNGVVQFDWMVNELLQTLKAKGYLENTLVVISADHGEMLGENGFFGHRFSVDESVLNIPLIMLRAGYSAEPWPEHALVSQVDIAPTILQELGLAIPAIWQGEPLQFALNPRVVFFQQGEWAGLYSTQILGVTAKYWFNSRTGVELLQVFEPFTMRALKALPDEQQRLLQALKPQWRAKVANTLVQGQSH